MGKLFLSVKNDEWLKIVPLVIQHLRQYVYQDQNTVSIKSFNITTKQCRGDWRIPYYHSDTKGCKYNFQINWWQKSCYHDNLPIAVTMRTFPFLWPWQLSHLGNHANFPIYTTMTTFLFQWPWQPSHSSDLDNLPFPKTTTTFPFQWPWQFSHFSNYDNHLISVTTMTIFPFQWLWQSPHFSDYDNIPIYVTMATIFDYDNHYSATPSEHDKLQWKLLAAVSLQLIHCS